MRGHKNKKKNEDVLRATGEEIKQLFDASPVAMAVSASVEGRVEAVNHKFTELFGYTIEDIPDVAHWWPLAYPDETYREEIKSRWETQVEQATRGKGQPEPVEAIVTCKDGSHRYIEFRFSPIGDRLLVTFVDLTERKQVEESLKESEWRYREIFNNVLDTLFLLEVTKDGHFRNLEMNPAIEKSTGIPRLQMIGKLIEEVVPEEVASIVNAKYRHCVEAGHLIEEEVKLDLPAGQRFFHSTLIPARDETGRISRIIGISRDITDEKRAEQERLAHLRFFESMNRVNQAIQGTNDLKQMMTDVLEVVLAVFECDRVWLIYPCDPGTATWQVRMERTQPDCQKGIPIGIEIPLTPPRAEIFRILLEANGPVKFGPGLDHEIDAELTQIFGVNSHISMALYPKVSKPWSFGLHQCSYARVWTDEEERLFQEIGRRISDALTSLLMYRNLQEGEERYRMLFHIMDEGVAINEIIRDDNGDVVDYRILEVNPAFTKNSAFTHEQVLGKRATELYHMSPEFIRDWWQKHSEEQQVVHTEMYYAPTDRWFHITTTPPQDNRFATFSMDITARKKAEAQLLASEQLFRALVENSPDFIARYDQECRRIYVNPAIQKLFGTSSENMLGKTPADESPVYTPQVFMDYLKRVIATGAESVTEMPYRTAEGEMHWSHMRFVPEFGPDGKVKSVLHIGRDIHEIKENERRFRMLAENFPDFVIRFDRDGRFLYVNPAFEKALGTPAESLIARTIQELPSLGNQEQNHASLTLIRRAFDEAIANESEVRWDTETGERIFDIRYVPEKDATGNVVTVLCVARDVTEPRQAEKERLSHLRFFEYMDRVNRAIQGTNDLEQMMRDVLDVLLDVFDCDRAFLTYPCDPEAAAWKVPMERFRPEYPGPLPIGVEMPLTPDGAAVFRALRATNGPVQFGPGLEHEVDPDIMQNFKIKSYIAIALYPKVGKPWSFGLHQCSYARVWTMEEQRLLQEVGHRISDALTSLLAYRNVYESEERYRLLVNLSPDAIGIDSEAGIVFVNPAAVKMLGARDEGDLIGRSIFDFMDSSLQAAAKEAISALKDSNQPTEFVEEKFLRLDGTRFDAEVAGVPFHYQGQHYIQFVARDITERKQHEREHEAIIVVSTALRQATTRTEILNVILEQTLELFEADGVVLVMPNLQTGGFTDEMGRGEVGERLTGLNIPPNRGISNWVITNRKPYLNNNAHIDPLFYRPDLLGDSHCVACSPLIAKDQAIGALWIARRLDLTDQDLRLLNAITDIAANAIHRVMLHEQTEQQLHHLIALHQIDLAISSNFDQEITLKVILNSVKNELEVDAASILLLHPVTHTLNYAAGIGFRTSVIENSRVRLGDEGAGRAAREYRIVSYPDLRLAHERFSRASMLADEGFASYYAAPLVVKGQVKGVLEIFHQKTFGLAQEWMNYFETLATQVAIAIENASLFENLQRSNMELTLAYDATIEGWSRALDLRDKETEGHTQRVTEMVLKLAQKMGMSDAEKLDLRRGALLHDIGKMGVPDSILHKPGPLSDAEVEIIRQHPAYAYRMLFPITYLKRALEIPFCHHEKWDGSGYPRGLKGEEIPLSARLFTIVDVFDALTSDRPYRAAWPIKTVLTYIQEQSGKYFDPAVVTAFLQIMRGEN